MLFKRRVSVSYSLLALLNTTLQSKCSGGSLSQCRTPRLRNQCGAFTANSFLGGSLHLQYLSLCESPTWGCIVILYILAVESIVC